MIVSPYITFKTDRQKSEWLGESLHPAIRVIVEYVARWHFLETGYPAVITELIRTRDEQRSIYPNDPNKRSPHEFGRAADIRTSHISLQTEKIAALVNIAFPYDYGTLGLPTAKAHEVNGHGFHLHVQVGPKEPDPRDKMNAAA